MLNQEEVNCLKEARLMVKSGWCRGCYARNAEGEAVNINFGTDEVDTVCLVGSIAISARKNPKVAARPLLDAIGLKLQELGKSRNIPGFNDNPNTEQADVLHVLELVISENEANLNGK